MQDKKWETYQSILLLKKFTVLMCFTHAHSFSYRIKAVVTDMHKTLSGLAETFGVWDTSVKFFFVISIPP